MEVCVNTVHLLCICCVIYAAFGNLMQLQISVAMKDVHIKLKLKCTHEHEGNLLLVLTHARTHT